MSPSNTTFFCIPGAFCPAAFFDKLTPILQAQGYSAHALDLPCMSPSLKAEGKSPGLYDDAAFVRDQVSKCLDQGKDVIIVASSYGGAVTFEACRGITPEDRKGQQDGGGKLKHLVLLGGLLCEAGLPVGEVLGHQSPVGSEGLPPGETHVTAFDAGTVGTIFYGSLPKQEQEHYGAMCKPISAKVFVEPLTFAGWREVPTTLIIGDNDLALAPAMQHDYFDKAVDKGVKNLRKRVFEGGDHLTMLTHPKEVAKVCFEADGSN